MGGSLLAWVDKFLVLYFRQSRNALTTYRLVPLRVPSGTATYLTSHDISYISIRSRTDMDRCVLPLLDLLAVLLL